MKLFLDFDDTLFDSVFVEGKFWFDMRKIYERGGWSVEMIEETVDDFSGAAFDGKPNTYSIEKHLAAMHSKQPSATYEAVLEECQLFMRDLDRYVFPDVLPFLKRFSKQDLFIVTFGDPGFQKVKILGSHIESYFQDILVTEGQPKMEMIRDYAREHNFLHSEQIVFVDDKDKYFEKGKEDKWSVVTVLMDRKGITEKYRADYRVMDCDELAEILKNLEQDV